MPSGAKKRKAAKKKLQKDAHNSNTDGSHSLGNDNAKSHDEREIDGGEVERESSEEPVVNNLVEVNEEGSLGEQNVTEIAKEENLEGCYNDVPVNVEEADVRQVKNGEHKRSSSSSSSSSSSDDELSVEKERPVVEEVPGKNPVISDVVYNSVEESIPIEESVKQVISLPHELNAENEDEAADNTVTSHVIESELKQTSDEVVASVDEKEKVSNGVTDFMEEKNEAKVIQVVDEGSEKLSGFVGMTKGDGENSLPQSSGDAAYGNYHVKESETHKYVEEKPFMSSDPLPVRRTSWTNCCGLFEVFSGGASR